MIDTAGCDLEEDPKAEGESTSNEGEAGVVVKHVQALLAAGSLVPINYFSYSEKRSTSDIICNRFVSLFSAQVCVHLILV
jgi:hypothetical protein